MKNFNITLLILCVLIFLSTGQNAGEANSAEVKSQKTDALKNGCELIVHINGAYISGDFKILTKENFARKNIERAMFINAIGKYGIILTAKKDDPSKTVTWMTEDGKRVLDSVSDSPLYYPLLNVNTLNAVIEGEDVLVTSYKDKEKVTDVLHNIRYLRAMERLTGEDKFLHGFNFTYNDLINAVKKLINQNELKLAGDTISVKKRDIKELPDDAFKMHFGFVRDYTPVPHNDSQ